MKKKILVAVAWPYVNGDIHVGHLAGYLLPADVFTRYKRLRGDDVLMVSGSDCHGTPITVQADKEGIAPQEVVDKYHKKDIELFDLYNLDYSLYTKTTTDNHKRVVQQLFLDLLENDFIVKDTMQQYYSSQDDEFLPDRYVEGTCPHCKAEEQRADQCEDCGRWLKDGELLDAVSKKSGKPVELRETEHYFLDFKKLEKELGDYLGGKIDGTDKRDIWRNWVYKEARGWLNEGLEKRAITRDINWGIELPKDRIPEDKLIKDIEKKKIYVWFEAVIGYLSAPQEWSITADSKQQTANSKTMVKDVTEDYIFRYYAGQDTDWKKWWLEGTSEHFYFMGQDNLVFHTLMWPAELLGAKKGYTLPYNVVVNKFMNFNDAKFSKSRGNVVDSREIAEKFGTDAVRYFILSNLPENKESNFTWERFRDANNNELVANLGNFINRTLVFYSRYFAEHLEDFRAEDMSHFKEDIEKQQNAVIAQAQDHLQHLMKNLDECKFVEAMGELMEISRIGNYQFSSFELWLKVKKDSFYHEYETLSQMLTLLNLIEILKVAIRPFFPEAFERLTEMLGLEPEEIEVGKDLFEFKPITGYPNLKEVKPLFGKIEEEEISRQQTADSRQSSEAEVERLLEPIRVVKIVKIEKHPDADRLLLVTVDKGNETQTIVTGADNIEVGDLVTFLGEGNVVPGWLLHEGKEIKLDRRKIRGVESAGMILAEDEIGIGRDHSGIYKINAEESDVGKSILEVMDDPVGRILTPDQDRG